MVLAGSSPKNCIQFLIFLVSRRISVKTLHLRGLPLSQPRQASRTPFKNPRPIESKVVEKLERRQQKTTREFEVSKAARERAARSFFGSMPSRSRLKNQNVVKYVDRSAHDRDLMFLKKVLGNKISLNETSP